METRLLRMFCAVARRGSLVAAARDLHLTPSAVSHGLKSLEHQVRCRLLDRVGKKVYLNQAGEQLLAQVEKPLAALNAAEESVKRLGKWGQSRLRIGASASACQYILPGVIKKLKKDFHNASIQIESGDSGEMVDLIVQNQIDMVLGLAPPDDTGLEVRTLFKDELLFTFAPSHPWATARSIPRDQIALQPFILYQRASITARLLDDYFRSLQIVPLTIMEIANIAAIKELVKLNLGVAILAPWTAEQELKQGTLRMRPMGPKPLRREGTITCMAGRRLNLIEETFCKLCIELAASLRTDREQLPG